tara:strand:+ start:488 stop:715 length:228 start_codon:yes stop_codon:yes gene_type:complete
MSDYLSIQDADDISVIKGFLFFGQGFANQRQISFDNFMLTLLQRLHWIDTSLNSAASSGVNYFLSCKGKQTLPAQ